MEITPAKFKSLNLNQRGELTFQNNMIAKRSYYNQTLCLYDLGNFFVEVWYEIESNSIRDITVVEDMRIIDRYINAEQ